MNESRSGEDDINLADYDLSRIHISFKPGATKEEKENYEEFVKWKKGKL